jgi:predicted 2-oxoglutarate/Fe(II)-dependent dioxygenase YbiX
MNCVIPWGTFTGADLLLWELKKRVQVSEGEVIFFRSKALTHNVSPLTAGSNRNVLDLYSHQAVLEVDRKRRRPQDKTLTVNPAEKSKQKRRQT